MLDQLDKFMPPEIDIERLRMVDMFPAENLSIPIGGLVSATKDFNRTLPILRSNHGLDQEGWLFVSHPTVDFGESSNDAPFS
jgi:hypothetical protein